MTKAAKRPRYLNQEAKAMLDIAMAKLPTASLRQRNRAKTFEQAHYPQRCDRYRWRGQRGL